MIILLTVMGGVVTGIEINFHTVSEMKLKINWNGSGHYLTGMGENGGLSSASL